jgi:endonuclease-3 related protein
LWEAYQRLRARFGHQGWWPGESPFEICLGAILVQNTRWTNVERALGGMKQRQLLDPARLRDLPQCDLEELLRPTGTFRIKAARVRHFLDVLWTDHGGSLEHLLSGPVDTVRRRLLAIPGIGPETADCLLLYAGGKLSFVIDAYTRRVLERHGWVRSNARYEVLQQACAAGLSMEGPAGRVDLWQDFHAQMTMLGQRFCRASAPICRGCPLEPLLPEGKRSGRPDDGKPPAPGRPVTGATHDR